MNGASHVESSIVPFVACNTLDGVVHMQVSGAVFPMDVGCTQMSFPLTSFVTRPFPVRAVEAQGTLPTRFFSIKIHLRWLKFQNRLECFSP